MKRSLLLGLLVLVLTGCRSMGDAFPGMDVFSIDHRRLEPVDGDGAQPRENPRDQLPGELGPERVHGTII